MIDWWIIRSRSSVIFSDLLCISRVILFLKSMEKCVKNLLPLYRAVLCVSWLEKNASPPSHMQYLWAAWPLNNPTWKPVRLWDFEGIVPSFSRVKISVLQFSKCLKQNVRIFVCYNDPHVWKKFGFFETGNWSKVRMALELRFVLTTTRGPKKFDTSYLNDLKIWMMWVILEYYIAQQRQACGSQVQVKLPDLKQW